MIFLHSESVIVSRWPRNPNHKYAKHTKVKKKKYKAALDEE